MSENSPENKRLLVLTSATGAGHDTHAQATADWCTRLYGDRVQVTISHALEDSHFLYRQGVDFYNFIQRRMPWFHHIYYNVVELMDVLNPGTVGLGRDHYVRLLERTRPHAILSVMDCLNRGYFELAKQTLGPETRCATYCTEFEGGYGFSRNWVNPRGDFFLARTSDAAKEGTKRGVPARLTVVSAHWAPPAFYEAPLSAEEKSDYLRQELQLDPHRFTLLLSTGGAGANNHVALLQALAPLGDKIQVIALCGRDVEGRKELEAWVRQAAPFKVRTLGFSKEMPQLLQISSAVVARAGATTAGEVLLCACPIIFNALGGTMPQEMPTRRFFEKRGIDLSISKPAQIKDLVARWLEHPELLVQLEQRMKKIRDQTTPQNALDLLLD